MRRQTVDLYYRVPSSCVYCGYIFIRKTSARYAVSLCESIESIGTLLTILMYFHLREHVHLEPSDAHILLFSVYRLCDKNVILPGNCKKNGFVHYNNISQCIEN